MLFPRRSFLPLVLSFLAFAAVAGPAAAQEEAAPDAAAPMAEESVTLYDDLGDYGRDVTTPR